MSASASATVSAHGSGHQEKRRAETQAGTLDQWFTPRWRLLEYAGLIFKYADQHGIRTFVDSSAGTGELGLFLFEKGLRVIMFDVDDSHLCKKVRDKACERLVFHKKDFMTVQASDVPSGSVVGFNPPFGFHSKIAKEFIRHASSLSPKVMVWLTKNLHIGARRFLPTDFTRVHYESETVHFVRPGKKPFKQAVGVSAWVHNPKAHKKEMRKIQADMTRDVPDGFALEMCKSLWVKEGMAVQKTPFKKWPACVRQRNHLIVRRCGNNAGFSAFVFDGGNRCNQLSPTKWRIRDPKDEISPADFYRITVADEFAGPDRTDFFRSLGPFFAQRRKESAGKHGLARNDIAFALEMVVKARRVAEAEAEAERKRAAQDHEFEGVEEPATKRANMKEEVES